MHALGIYHEQSRPGKIYIAVYHEILSKYSDRDDYVFIDAEEVTDGHLHNFNKYDFQLVMGI